MFLRNSSADNVAISPHKICYRYLLELPHQGNSDGYLHYIFCTEFEEYLSEYGFEFIAVCSSAGGFRPAQLTPCVHKYNIDSGKREYMYLEDDFPLFYTNCISFWVLSSIVSM